MNMMKGVFGGKDSSHKDDRHLDRSSDVGHSVSNVSKSSDVVAAGLPDVGQTIGHVEYQDTKIESHVKELPVTDVVANVEVGKDIGTKMETVMVPRTVMQKEVVQVPEVVMEKRIVEKPVTETVEVPRIQKDVEMREEKVSREEVVMDKAVVQKPTTVMKPVQTEEPKLQHKKKMIALPHEVMRKIKVIRPEVVTQTVVVQRPVQVKKKVKVMKPVPRPRMVKVRKLVPTKDLVNITVPELDTVEKTIEVPHEEERSVTYMKPVTVVRNADDKHLTPYASETSKTKTKTSSSSSSSSSDEGKRVAVDRDWAEIPVGMPFTEMLEKAKNFTVTGLHKETTSVRRTWMMPKQVPKLGFKWEDVEVEIIQTEMVEDEVEVLETELQEFEEQVQVTLMKEVEEKWPVAKERQHEVWTSEVTLEPQSVMLPELAMESVEVEVPRTVVKEETIMKPHQVEREVMVTEARTVMKPVEVEQPVERMRDVEVDRPVVVYDEKQIEVPVTIEKEVHTSDVADRKERFLEQEARTQTKLAEYKDATTVMKPVPIDAAHLKIDETAAVAPVSAAEIDALAHRELQQQPGVAVGATVMKQHVQEYGVGDTSMRRVEDVRKVVPGAFVEGAQLPQPTTDVGTHGTLTAEPYVEGAAHMIGRDVAVEGLTDPALAKKSSDVHAHGVTTDKTPGVYYHHAPGAKADLPDTTAVPVRPMQTESSHATGTGVRAQTSSSSSASSSDRGEVNQPEAGKKKKKKGLIGRIKDKLT